MRRNAGDRDRQLDFGQISWGNEFCPGDRVRCGDELGTVKYCGRYAGTVFVFFDQSPDRASPVAPEALERL